jgi:hypothetical protein
MLLPLIIALSLLVQQSTPQDPPADIVPDVVVRGVSPDAVGRFVGGLTLPGEHGRFQGQVARWDDRLCVEVSGGVPKVNAYLTAQIAANFASLEIPHQAPGCDPTVAVVITRDADLFAETFADRNRRRMFEGRPAAVEAFVGPSRPVRWRHLVRTDQQVLPGSRLQMATVRSVQQSVIVVDAGRASAPPLDALAAYLAFVALVDMPAQPETGGQRTILSLFDEAVPNGPRALTHWDRAFIRALYRVTPDVAFGFQQTEIEGRMRQELASPGG